MSVEVRVPTILRAYTGGDKIVTGDGADLRALIADLDGRYPGIGERLIDEQGLRLVAAERAERRVHGDEAAFEIDQCHADRRIAHRAAQAPETARHTRATHRW